MSERARKQLLRFYNSTDSYEQLPWHHPEPPLMLQKVINHRSKTARVLDIGCGAGTNAIYLAQQGYEVTAVDFIGQAVRLTRDRAAQADVHIEVVEVDVLQWTPSGTFDLILDVGCLHGMRGEERVRYRGRLLQWLSDTGDYVLIHFTKRHLLDWRPIGPRRIPRQKILNFFSPELEEQDHHSEIEKLAFPIGPIVLVGSYWFRRRSR